MEKTAHQQYCAALVAAIGELSNVPKTASNPYFKSKYAPLDAIVDATRPILAKHGLAIQQLPIFEDGMAGVKTTILHSEGHSESSVLLLALKDQSPQGIGGAITYARRYALAAVVGLATEDDLDGNEHLSAKPDARPAVAKAMDKNPTVRPAGEVIATWKNVEVTGVKIAASSKPESSKKWTLYSVTFNDNGKVLEAMTFDEKLYTSAATLGDEGKVIVGVAAGKKDPSKWELVSIQSANEKA